MVSVSRLVGKKVIGSNAYVLGEITGADVDTEKWLGNAPTRGFDW